MRRRQNLSVHTPLRVIALVTALSSVSGCAQAQKSTDAVVVIERGENKLIVKVHNKLFTEYRYNGNNKPILYPIIGPHGIGMTRNFPMKPTPGEAEDHRHHRSLWFTHGRVNGVDFWLEKRRSGGGVGQVVQDKLLNVSSGAQGVIHSSNKWVGPDGAIVCTDTRTITFSPLPDDAMAVDYEVVVHASNGPVTFGDTKEGTMAIRTHPNLRLKNGKGVTTANGHALNSEGHRDGDLWGKRARWVDYWGDVDGHTVGVAIFDHPQNPRHPTWWHARDYGLVAANAFGIHNFERKEKGAGDLTVAAGSDLEFRYRFVFHKGSAEDARVAQLYDAYTVGR
jgi:hypothetical protein